MSDPVSDALDPSFDHSLDHPPAGGIEPALLAEWLRLFVNRLQPYAVQQADGSYRWVYEDCTPALMGSHLAGEATLALSSTDARGWCRWACLDVDVPGALPQLLAVRAALAELGLPGLVEGSRRGGHLWLFFDELVCVTAVRYTVGKALASACEAGVEVPTYELYPDTGAGGILGHAVRLPLGIHRKTCRRYPLYDGEGLPCVFSSPQRAAAFLLAVVQQRCCIPAAFARRRWAAFVGDGGARGRPRPSRHSAVHPPGHLPAAGRRDRAADAPRDQTAPSVRSASQVAGRVPPLPASPAAGPRIGTRALGIRWVDAHVSLLDLLEAFVPESDVRRVGRGFLAGVRSTTIGRRMRRDCRARPRSTSCATGGMAGAGGACPPIVPSRSGP